MADRDRAAKRHDVATILEAVEKSSVATRCLVIHYYSDKAANNLKYSRAYERERPLQPLHLCKGRAVGLVLALNQSGIT